MKNTYEKRQIVSLNASINRLILHTKCAYVHMTAHNCCTRYVSETFW